MPDSPPPRVYARHLLPFGYGYPLWTPELGHQFLCYRRDGLRIGDVGVIVPENGSFDVFFNICLPRDHPFHRVNGVPENFVRIDLDELDVAIYPHAENPGSVISTSAVTTLRTVEPSDGAGQQNALTYEFSFSSSGGALLILPEGAESYTLLKRMAFRDVATRNGVDWYNFAEQRLGRIITHDSLYLITGCHKSHSWSVAAFHEASSQTGATEFPAQFKAGQAREGNISESYTWETTRALHWRVGPLGSDRTAIPNQAVFVSGFKIAIRDNILGRKRVEVEVGDPPTQLKLAKLYDSGEGHSRAGKVWRRLVSKSGGERTGEQAEADSANDPGAGPGAADDFVYVGGRVAVSHIPETLQSVHPSGIVNRYLLSKEPSAAIAVTHDSQWSILFEKGLLKLEDLGYDGWLESIVSENYRLVSQDGVVCLQTMSDSSIRLTDIDDAVCEAWKEGELDDAEELLSKQIIRRTGSDHFAFANRALIRARLRHWDAALRDAETSIGIQPSVAAHVAKGFALFGQQKYASAVHAFNVALRECDVRDKVLVSLVKSTVLFEVGYHAESMAEIADLVEHCPVEVKSACSAAQGEMYVRHAATATKNKDYHRALQLLSCVQSLGPFHATQELEIVSLICGWGFNNLQFSAHQRKCEALYVAGRINEAVESLGELTHDLVEDVRTRKDNAGWIATFTQRCLGSLESLGDSALASQNYTEAIAHYSAALSMGPTTRESILVKRSTAHAAVGAWNSALNDADEAITLNPLSPWGHERKLAAMQGMGRYDEAIKAFNRMLSTHHIYNNSQNLSIQNPEHVAEVGGPPDRLFALIIAINNYAWPDCCNLGGAVADAEAIKQYLKEMHSASEEHILTLYDEKATRQAIIDAFKELRNDQRINKGDPIVIFYAGHGGEVTVPHVWGCDSKIQCLIPQDYEAAGTEPILGREPIPDHTIRALIEDIAEAKGDNITVILDCCYSSSGTSDQEYVPRSVKLDLNIPEALDADIWRSRVGAIISGFAYHGSPRSHVLLAACGEKELAYEHKGRGQFTIALLKALQNCAVDDELTYVTYANLLKRTRLEHPFVQHPRCEGLNQHRLLFNGRVSAERQVYYPASRNGGKYVIGAGLVHGVSRGVEFMLYDDKRKRKLGIVLVDEASVIKDLKTTVTADVRLTGVSFAKLSGIGKLPLYVDLGNFSSTLETLRHVDGYSADSQTFCVVDAEEAKLEVAMENDLVVFKVLDQRVKHFGLTELPHKTALGSVARVLGSAAHYYWFLDLGRERDRISTKHEVAVDFYLLNIDYDDYGEPLLSPVEPGFCRKDPKLDNSDVIDFIVDPDAFYGIKITNKTPWDLYLNAFMFNNASLSIFSYYTQSTADTPKAPLRRGGTFTIGYGTGTPPLSYSLEGGQNVDVGYLKIFFTTWPVDLSDIAQLSPFSNINAREGPDDDKHRRDRLGVFRVVSRLLSLGKPDTVDTWFTLDIPVVQRRYAAV